MSAGADPRSRRPFDDMAFVVGPIRGARALLACIDDSGRPVERRFKADLEETGFFTSHLPRLMTRRRRAATLDLTTVLTTTVTTVAVPATPPTRPFAADLAWLLRVPAPRVWGSARREYRRAGQVNCGATLFDSTSTALVPEGVESCTTVRF